MEEQDLSEALKDEFGENGQLILEGLEKFLAKEGKKLVDLNGYKISELKELVEKFDGSEAVPLISEDKTKLLDAIGNAKQRTFMRTAVKGAIPAIMARSGGTAVEQDLRNKVTEIIKRTEKLMKKKGKTSFDGMKEKNKH